jgi:hypothetical protein
MKNLGMPQFVQITDKMTTLVGINNRINSQTHLRYFEVSKKENK